MALQPRTLVALALLAGGGLIAWQLLKPTPEPSSPRTPVAMDNHSFARPNQVKVTHLNLDLDLDFDKKAVSGTATLSLERSDPGAELILDTRDLTIGKVEGSDGQPRSHRLAAADPILGSALHVQLGENDDRVTLHYRTRPEAAALQWLSPSQTSGELPFLFTQGQAILTRTWIPLQDTPGVRITYEARVRAPAGLRVVMSAPERQQEADGSFLFKMPQPIPSYLLALACGDIAHRDISDRCRVYAEPAIVEGAARELQDMDKMLSACIEAFGEYRWGRYDVIILPPSFPFGGMENPTLTFATPTILAGDKSLVSLIAHELAHSWSGNLVTNATWRDFWLNEGFTVYLEQRIMAIVYGDERARMEILIGLEGLQEELSTLEPKDQILHIDLSGRNPDDGMTAVPYDKGAAFLRRLEQVFGRERFDRFLTGYFNDHAFRSITTEQFLTYLQEHLLASDPDRAKQVDIELWVRGPGLPADTPRPESAAMARADAAREAWFSGKFKDEMTAGFVTHQWLRFISGLPEDLTAEQMEMTDAQFGFLETGNSEILAAWLRRAIRCGYRAVGPRLEEFLFNVGRRKFLKPLYEELAKTDEGMRMAREIYGRARPRYHAVSVRTIDDILKWK